MNVRRMLVAGLAVLGMTAALLAPPASAQVPELPALPLPPGSLPPVDPANPVVPSVPYIPVPEELEPVAALGSPLAPTTCTAAFLVPLVGIVVIATVFAESPVPPPVPPGALLPAFSGLFTVCALTPFPAMRSCDPDRQVQNQARALPQPPEPPALPPEVPVAVPKADLVSLLPPPVASLVSEVIAAQALIEGSTGQPLPIDAGPGTAGFFGCY